jgi:hypothetical protein
MTKLCIQEGIIAKGGSINGVTVAMTRSPIPFIACLKIKVVQPNSELAKLCSAYQVAVSNLACYISGGDHDGDGYLFTPIPSCFKVNLLTKEEVYATLLLRTGKGAVDANQEAYIKDHWTPKWDKKSSLESPHLLQDKHFAATVRMELDPITNVYTAEKLSEQDLALRKAAENLTEQDGLYSLNALAAETQKSFVGWLYQFANKCSFANTIYKASGEYLKSIDAKYNAASNGKWFTTELIGSLWELYEGGSLGGYDHAAYRAISHLLNKIGAKTKREDYTDADFTADLAEAKLNDTKAIQFLEAAKFVRRCRSLCKKACLDSLPKTAYGFMVMASEIADLLSRAKFMTSEENSTGDITENVSYMGSLEVSSNKMQVALVYEYLNWLAINDPQGHIAKTNVVISHINNIIFECLPNILEKEDLQKLTHALRVNQGDKDNPLWVKTCCYPDFIEYVSPSAKIETVEAIAPVEDTNLNISNNPPSSSTWWE